MKIETIVVGPIETNCYVLSDPESREAVVIDAGDDVEEILAYIRKEQLQVKYLLNTHGHFDHILAVEDMRRSFGVPVYAGEKEADLLAQPDLNLSGRGREGVSLEADRWLKEGECFQLLGAEWKVLFTPGHTKGSVCYYVEKEQALFSGDTLFCQSVGRTDLPTGNSTELIKSVTGILSSLLEETRVYPGHGEGSSVGYEKRRNPLAQYV